MSKKVWLLTTIDNPVNPFADFDSWYLQDLALGHNTCALIDRVAGSGHVIDDGSLEHAKREIVKYNWSGKHLLVTDQDFDKIIKAASASEEPS